MELKNHLTKLLILPIVETSPLFHSLLNKPFLTVFMKHVLLTIAGLLFLFKCYATDTHRSGDKISRTNRSIGTIDIFDPTDSIGYTGSAAICAGKTILLTANYAPTGSTFQWRISTDGGTIWADIAGATNATYTANTPGLYSVNVTTAGVTTIYPPVNVTVHPYPVADFTFSPNSVCSTLPVSFVSTSSGTAITYQWNFGDVLSGADNLSVLQNPTHHFVGGAFGGTQSFTVKLTVTNSFGCVDTISKTVTTVSPGTQLGGTGFITYNGLPYFTQCASVASPFTFTNLSSSANSSYIIKWGDGSPDFSSTSFTSTTHTYSIGTYPLQFIVSGQDNCKDTGTYYVFVGNNPAVGLNNPGNTFICSGATLSFPVSGTENNPPGTVYTVSFNDGTPSLVFNQPPPTSVSHLFNRGSCGIPSPGFPNSFQATIRATNPCGASAASVVPIYVSQKDTASFRILPFDTVCINTPVTLLQSNSNGFGVSSTGVCLPGKGVWKITPTTGWTASGLLGNDFGLTDPTTWQAGANPLGLNFSVPGIYTIKLKAGSNTICSADSTEKKICINPLPIADFNLSATQGCAPLTVIATNNSNTPICGANTYLWTVSYANNTGCLPNTTGAGFINGTTNTSVNPQFQFTSPGVYTITLTTRNSNGVCSTSIFRTVTVKTKPRVTLTAPLTACQNANIAPTASALNCFATTPATYLWTFTGATPSTANTQLPGNIVFNSAGPQTITLDVTNECGTTSVVQNITVKPAPDVIVPTNQIVCTGASTGGFTFSSILSGTTYTWTNNTPSIGLAASGNTSIPAFTAINTGALPVVAIITVTPTNNGCAGPVQTFTITVNPKPAKPAVVRPILYCLNETAVPLAATALSGNTLTWYNNAALVNGTATAFTPATNTAGVFNFYVTQTNSFDCTSDTAIIRVTVYAPISNNIIGSNQTLCSGNTPVGFTGTSPAGGNFVYSYQWQSSVDGGSTWTNITGATNAIYNSPGLLITTMYRRLVSSAPCNNDSSNVVTITIQGTLSNYDISAAQAICAGTTPNALTGQLPTGGDGTFIYQWQSSSDNIVWTNIPGANFQDYSPGILNTTTYFKRLTTSGYCSAPSSVVTITVNPTPVATNNSNLIYCNGAATGVITFSGTPTSGVAYAWVNDNTLTGLAASGIGNIPSFNTTNTSAPKIPLVSNISVTPTFTANNVSCTGNTTSFTVTVLPSILLNAIPDTVVCTGTNIAAFTPINDAGIFSGSTVQYSWTVSGSGTNLTNGTGSQLPAFTTINNSGTDLVSVITITPKYSYAGKTCDGAPVSFSVTVKSATAAASAGADTTLCAAPNYTMKATAAGAATGLWTQLSGATVSIVNPSLATTQVTGLQPLNSYQFVWTVTGFASCPATKDTVTISVTEALVNLIDNTAQTICFSQPVNITGQLPIGGNLSYQYQWQQSSDGITWINMPGQTGITLTFTPAQTVFVRRNVTSLPCFNASAATQIFVQPSISNNSISANQNICVNTTAATLQGSTPAGANGVYLYQWEMSGDGGATWNTISGATAQNYSPGLLTDTTIFRRIVSTNLCSGLQSSVSNVVTIIVYPNAVASFLPTTNIGCAPFTITPAIFNLQHFANRNVSYLWYANGNFLGAGTSFPGYTIAAPADSVIIKMIALNLFGCVNDSASYTFYTSTQPQPAFILSDTVGCGPLTIQFTNTTPLISSFTYQWNFGNGQTSNAAQPPPIIFAPNPNFTDTVYIVRLSVASACGVISTSKFIRVQSKPKVSFAPNITVGCSPMTVLFNNTSKGLGNSYTWHFGDGSAPVATSSATGVSHVFTTGIRDTFFVKLVAENGCGKDSLNYAIVVSPNNIALDFAVNGNQQSGCAPHRVNFINNSAGASSFTWNFSDGVIINTSKNIDTVAHNFLLPGTYLVSLRGTNGCSDTTTTETVIVYPKPKPLFASDKNIVCIGDAARFSNNTDSASSYLWQFGDGNTSTAFAPVHQYTTPGLFTVKLVAYRFNAPGSICVDSVTRQIQVVDTIAGTFTATDTLGNCTPFTIAFTNQTTPSVSAFWNFGDGSTGSGNSVTHTYAQAGVYTVILTVQSAGGCTYISTKTVRVLGPGGSWTHTTGYLCSGAARFSVNATNADSIIYNFGDGSSLVTTNNLVFHTYTNAGVYFPTVRLKNNLGCTVFLNGIDTIRVERINPGFTSVQQKSCGSTTVNFSDTSFLFFGKNLVRWNFADGTTGTGGTISHSYNTGGVYPIQMIVTGNSGCSDTVLKQLTVTVSSLPTASILGNTTSCVGYKETFTANVQSSDAVTVFQWTLSNGAAGTANPFNYTFSQAGNYTLQLVVGTVNGCYDTVLHTIRINPSPVINASPDITLCRGSSAPLLVTGTGTQFNWLPLQGLSCYNCTNPIASPIATTPYLAQTTNSFGCVATDTVVVTIIQPLKLNVSPTDSICIGTATTLLASGATQYTWSPATALSSTSVSNPTASPSVTTRYRVVGYDGFNCFTDTGYVLVAVGQYPIVNLGPDVTLAAGTQHPFGSSIQNGPVSRWLWAPANDLSCSTCPLPILNVKKDASYTVTVFNSYGCADTDSINVKVFCESSQVFIPNAFTPDGDGINDVLMVRGKGIVMVKTFRIFNRWGEVVFEKANFPANNVTHGWNGLIKGVAGGPDVFVYTAEVLCENGAAFTYKGNVSIIK